MRCIAENAVLATRSGMPFAHDSPREAFRWYRQRYGFDQVVGKGGMYRRWIYFISKGRGR